MPIYGRQGTLPEMGTRFLVVAVFVLLLVPVAAPAAVVVPFAGNDTLLPPVGAGGATGNPFPLLPNISPADRDRMAENWFEQGFVLTNQQRYTDAIVAYGKALSYNGSLLNAWYYTGDAYFQLGRYPDALLAFENATAVDPDFVDAYFYEALVFGKLGRPGDREDALRKGLDAAERREANAGSGSSSSLPAPEPISPVLPFLATGFAIGLRKLSHR